MAKKSVGTKQVLCKTTCLARNMGLGYCVAGKRYPVPANVKTSKHFEELRSPKEEMGLKEESKEESEKE